MLDRQKHIEDSVLKFQPGISHYRREHAPHRLYVDYGLTTIDLLYNSYKQDCVLLWIREIYKTFGIEKDPYIFYSNIRDICLSPGTGPLMCSTPPPPAPGPPTSMDTVLQDLHISPQTLLLQGNTHFYEVGKYQIDSLMCSAYLSL